MDMNTNIRNRFYIYQLLLLIFLTFTQRISIAQSGNDSALTITTKTAEYRRQVNADPEKQMVELKSLIPTINYDLRYASTNNFMNRLMYPAYTNVTFMRTDAAKGLAKVQEELAEKGLGLKIYDAYRPYSVTVRFWELVKDERYVANPSKGSGHNRGIAVDLTIIELKSGEELDMGTGFDNFSDTAHWSFTDLSEKIKENRKLLRSLMEKNGFKAFDTEWWHFYLINGNKYELLDIPFKKLSKNL
jgi:zinc D-Ala-D-Ala dipeptidase